MWSKVLARIVNVLIGGAAGLLGYIASHKLSAGLVGFSLIECMLIGTALALGIHSARTRSALPEDHLRSR